jgi:hypothetical protein
MPAAARPFSRLFYLIAQLSDGRAIALRPQNRAFGLTSGPQMGRAAAKTTAHLKPEKPVNGL